MSPYHADGNQAEIVKALRDAGCSVAIIGGANGQDGVPDLLVGRRMSANPCIDGVSLLLANFLLEVKRPRSKGRTAGKLSPAQEAWHRAWRGQVAVVRTVEDALRAVGLMAAAKEA